MFGRDMFLRSPAGDLFATQDLKKVTFFPFGRDECELLYMDNSIEVIAMAAGQSKSEFHNFIVQQFGYKVMTKKEIERASKYDD
jgi:hypothetical protein